MAQRYGYDREPPVRETKGDDSNESFQDLVREVKAAHQKSMFDAMMGAAKMGPDGKRMMPTVREQIDKNLLLSRLCIIVEVCDCFALPWDVVVSGTDDGGVLEPKVHQREGCAGAGPFGSPRPL